MKNIFILLLTCLVPLTNAEAMVRLKEVYQKGAGGTGTIKVEFNGNYKESKAELAYKSDSVEIMMRDAFTIPANRTFKVSSDKSSVSRIIAKQTPGNMVKLILYFRIPIDVIQKTAKIVVEDNVLNFTYKTSFNETIAQMPQEETIEQKEKGQEQEQPATIGTYSMAIDQKSLEDNGVDELIKSEQPVVVRSYSKHLSKLLAVLKGAVIVLLVIAFSVGVFYLYKRYSFGMMEKMSMTFGRKEMKISGDEIKVLSSLDLNHGKTIHVVEYMGDRMLIATSKDSVTMLSRMDKSAHVPEEQDLFKSNHRFKDRFEKEL